MAKSCMVGGRNQIIEENGTRDTSAGATGSFDRAYGTLVFVPRHLADDYIRGTARAA